MNTKIALISLFLTLIISGCSKNANLGNLPGGKNIPTSPGVIVNSSKLTLSSQDVAFANTNINDTSLTNLTLTNKGNKASGNIALMFAIQPSAPFTLVNDDCSNKSLEVDESCSFQVQFKPIIASSGFNILKAADSQSVTQVVLRGQGINPTDGISNDPPTANNGLISLLEDSVGSGVLTGTDPNGKTVSYEIVSQPSKGVVNLINPATGQYSYTPITNENGADSFTFKVKNSDGTYSTNASINVMITPVNDVPVTNNLSISTNEDTVKNGTVSAVDVDGDSLVYSVVAQGTKGLVSMSSTTGSFTYTPNANANGTDTFTFKVNDGTVESNIATVTVNITPINDLPVANNQVISTTEDTPKSGILSGSDADGSTLTYSLATQGHKGTIVITDNNTGAFTYTPNANANGTDTFTFRVNDGTVDSNLGTVTVNISPVNDTPIATDGTFSTNEDTDHNGVLVASDVDGDTLTYTLISSPSKGTVTITNSANGSFTYTPNANANGSDSFTFRVNDGTVDSNVATINLTINSVNDAPVSVNSSFSTLEDTAKNSSVSASDIDLDSLTYSVVAPPSHGSVVMNNDGTYVYTPDLNYNGSDSFTFKANDGTTDSNVSTVSITVNPVNDAPIADTLNKLTLKNIPVNIELTGSDVDGDSLTYTVVANPSHGTLSGTVPNLVYTPNNNYSGADSFTFKVNDGTVDSNTATVSISITNTNTAPVSTNQSISTNEDTSKNGTLVATDIDGDTLTYSVVVQGTKGTVTITNATTGAFTYTPNANANGSDSFTFKANDGALDSNTSTVNVTINPVNDAPVANNQSIVTNEDSVYSGALTGSDIDGDTLTYSIVAQGSKGTVVITNATTGAFTYTPNSNANGSDSFTFKVNDGTLNSNTATVSVTINSTNDVPVANSQSVTTPEDTTLNITLAGSDIDGDSLTYTIVSSPTNGTLSGTIPNLIYTPNANYNGSDSFTFKVNDGTIDSNTATISISVTAANDAPVANNQSITTNEDTSKNGTLVATDLDGDALTYSVVAQGTKGTVTITNASTGAFTYTPNANANGSDSFTFRANDGTTNSNTATVSITITPVNDAPVANNSSFSTNEDTLYSGTLSASDIDGDVLTYSVVAQGTKGTLTITNAATGAFTYTPAANANGSDSFTFKVNDGTVNSNTATVSVTINSVNDAPVASANSFTTAEDTAYNGTLVATDADGNSLTYSVVAQGSKGTVTITNASTGAFTYTPNANANGSDSFTFKVNDGTIDSNTATVSITVTPVNDAPVSIGDTFTTNEDTAYNGVLIASDVDGDALTYSVVAQGTKGTVTITNAATGTFTYTPNANANGSDSFTFRVNDGTVNSNTSTVNVTITPVNDAPVVSANSFSTNEDTAYNGTLTGTDADGNSLTYAIVANPTHGTVSLNSSTGAYTYTPTANYNGSDSFTYRANDGTVNSNTATVSITVIPVNDAPVWTTPTSVTLNTNKNTATGYTFAATDVDGDSIYYSLGVCSGGTCNLNSSTGVFTFTPNTNYTGTVGFSVRCYDGTAYCSPNTFITINIINPNTAPVASNLSAKVLVRTGTATINFSATDGEGDPLTYSVVSNPTAGTLSGTGSSRTYTMPAWTSCAAEGATCTISGTKLVKYGTTTNYLIQKVTGSFTCNNATFSDPAVGLGKTCWTIPATDSFTYKANDGQVDSNTATVSIDFIDWYNTSWTKRRKLVFNTPTTEDLTDFPVLVKLDNTRIDYAQVQSAGQDLRFIDNSGNVLSYEIESWNSSGTSYVWVKNSIGAGETNNHYIYMYYGNPSAAAGQNPTGVWTNGYVAVYHMAETTGNLLDSTSNNNDGTPNGTITRTSTGVMGNGYKNASASACFSVPHQASHLISKMTIETWAKSTTNTQTSSILQKDIYTGGNWYWAYSLENASGKMSETITDNSLGSSTYATATNDYTVGTWKYLAVTYNDATNTTAGYSNGSLLISNTAATRGMYTGSAGNTLNIIGDCSGTGFKGAVDEVRLSNVDRSDSWLKVQYISMIDGLISYAQEESSTAPLFLASYVIKITNNADDGQIITPTGGSMTWNSSGEAGSGTNWLGEEANSPAWGYYRFLMPVGLTSSNVINASLSLLGNDSANTGLWNSTNKYLKVSMQKSANPTAITAVNQYPGGAGGVTDSTTKIMWNSSSLTWNVGWNSTPNLSSMINEVAGLYSITSGNYIQLWVTRGATFNCGSSSWCQAGSSDYNADSGLSAGRLLIEVSK